MKERSLAPLRHADSRGFALVITLMMVVLAAVVAVGLLTTATLERTTARSVDDRYRAEVAVHNGLEAVKRVLTASPSAGAAITANDTFLVTRIDAPAAPVSPPSPIATTSYYYLASAQPGAGGQIDYYPLFSTGTVGPSATTAAINLTAGAPQPAVGRPASPPNPDPKNPGTNAVDVDNGKTNIIKAYPPTSRAVGPANTKWIELHDAAETAAAAPFNLPYQRFTYWTEDLSGYIDGAVAGNTQNGGSHQRANGTNANEIALFTVFQPTQPLDTSKASDSPIPIDKSIINNRDLLFTSSTVQQLTNSAAAQAALIQANVAVRLGTDNSGERNIVPFGYAYPTEGQPKKDLSALIKTKDVDGIAAAINTSLPNFASRAGGLPSGSFDYSKNLAANFIDYADALNAPTTDGSTYRGVGAFPFLVSMYDLNNWPSYSQSAGEYYADIDVTTYVQLWNPHNVPVNGTVVLHYENVDKLNVNGATFNYFAPPDLTTPVTMAPNEYKVLAFPVKRYTFDWEPTPPASDANIPFPAATTANKMTLTWNGRIADRTYKNVQRSMATVGMKLNSSGATTKWEWRGNAAPPIYLTTGSSSGGTPGDPRISFYLNRSWTDANYEDNSSWGGRLKLWKAPGTPQLQPSVWPDGGHDSTLGDNPTHSVTPDKSAAKVSLTPADANMWVSRLSTKGSLDSICELGNVFDPGQWKYTIPSTTAAPSSLPDIPTSASADAAAGGGYTLCIGRPEFSRFDTNGQRAWQLIDVFAVGTRTATSGLINVNTASFDVLRALAAGMTLTRDNAVVPAGPLYGAKSGNDANEADLFAQAVIASRPLLSVAQLNTIANSNGPYFANPNQWNAETASSTSSAQPTSWNDSGREELFSRIMGLASVRSRNFRVFVTGQALDKNGTVVSTVSKVFQVFLRPQRSASGAITGQQVEIRYEAFL